MKVFGLVLSVLLLLSAPIRAAEYQGKNIDGILIKGKALFSSTGGVYDVQVLFKGNQATLFFVNGDHITIKLLQSVISDPSDIEGVGGLGQYHLGGAFSIGLSSGDNPIGNPLQGFWRIRLDLTDFNDAVHQ
ncbi:MAG TPA: hypothetical protein V6D11_20310 [Waterburya sp.]|jgi:hypothetical protein